MPSSKATSRSGSDFWPNFWQEKWQQGQIGFHQDEFEPLLVKHFAAVPPGRVLVPLCGKSRDMIWLGNQGHQVLGVELSVLACEAFFSENFPGQTVKREPKGPFTLFSLGQYTLLCGDFFALTAADLLGVTALYDRAALIALPPELRARYAGHLKEVLPKTTKAPLPTLIITIEYPQEKFDGPPFSVGPAEVMRLYGIKHVAETDVSEHFKGNPRLAGLKILEHAFVS